MQAKIKQLISFSQSSLYFCNEAFNEIWHITQTPTTQEEFDVVSGHPFSFYGITLQYCFIMEYTKLLDANSSKESENVASLLKLNQTANDFLGNAFQSVFEENKKLLKQITTSELYQRLKNLRNKKFGHADSDEINNPWKVEGFTANQIEEMKRHIQVLLRIFNNILGKVSNAQFGLHDDDRTANFIRFQAKYKQYYFKNFRDAMNEEKRNKS